MPVAGLCDGCEVPTPEPWLAAAEASMIRSAPGTIEVIDIPYPSRLKAWWVVAAMFVASIVSVVDRGILTLVVDPVRHDLGISDVQVSLLQGLSFGIFYAVAGIPLGLLADRFSRRRLLLAGIAIWSAATFLGGLAASFGELFSARLVVGLGEAALAPCAVSMIGDMFPPDRRGRPISIYLLGQSLAGGLSVMLTGAILSGVPAGQFAWISWLDGLAPWRVAFLMAGAAGLPVIMMLLSYREPVRRGARLSADANTFRQALGYLRRNWILFLPYYAGFAMLVMMAYSINAWSATYLMRQFGLLPAQVGRWQGSVGIVLGTLGPLAAGIGVDWISRRMQPGGKLLFLVCVALLMIPATFAVLMPSPVTAISAFGFVTFFMPVIGTGMVTSIQEMVPNNMRGIGVSLFGLFNTITGQTLGPYFVATLAARGAEGAGQPLGWAMTSVCLPAILAAAALYAIAYAGFRRLLRRNGEFAVVVTAGG